MKRFFAIIFLVLILIAVCTYEEIFLNNFVSGFTTKAQALSTLIEQNENINTNNISNSLTELKNNWQITKRTLCFFTNYEKIKSMDESFIKLEAGINNNNKDLANENIAVICNYNQFFYYMMGFNLNNLF